MDIDQLATFVRVAELGSFSRAALDLQTAQPTLSRQVKKLEEELGVELLYRNGRGVALTHAGQMLLKSGRDILNEIDNTKREVRATRGVMAGSAVIGLPPTVGRVLSISLAKRLRAENPDVNLRIVESFSGNLLEWLSSGRIDVGVLYDEPHAPAMIAEPIVEEDLMLIGPVGQRPKLVDGSFDLVELGAVPLVAPSPPHGLRLHIERVAAAHAISLQVILEIDALYSMVEVVRSGIAYTILPKSSVQRDLDEGMLEAWPLHNPTMSRLLYVATASQRARAVAVRKLAQIVREEIVVLEGRGLWRRPST
ncbi:MAG: LysR substrate-binding domain-containing protein [Mesorhizobium sp.]|nr:LysR substrate-binding domain-containing protein [Mesorhizobium sp.]